MSSDSESMCKDYNFQIMATYKDLFGKEPELLSDFLPKTVNSGFLVALSQISCRTAKLKSGGSNYDPFVQWAMERLPLTKEGKNFLSRSVINKRPSNLVLWVELLNRPIKNLVLKNFKRDNYLGLLLQSLLIINDNEREIDDIPLYLVNNNLHKYQDNMTCQFYRSVKIFISDPSMQKYAGEFKRKYGVSLKDFIYISHITANIVEQKGESKTGGGWVITSKSIEETLLKSTQGYGFGSDLIKKVLDLVSFNQQECKAYAKSDAYKEHNFNFFNNKPLLKIDEDAFLPVDDKFVQNLVFNNLFHRVKAACGDKQAFMRDFGFAFERYVDSHVKYICDNSTSFDYLHIGEFKFGEPEKASSDSYIYHNDERHGAFTIVFETKSAKILDAVKRENGNREAVERSIRKLSLSPFKQQIKVTSEIIKSGVNPKITKDNIFYFVSVSFDDFPMLFGEWLQDDEDAVDFGELKSGGVYSINIEELELLAQVLSSNFPAPFSWVLEKYRTKYCKLSFKTYLSRLLTGKIEPELTNGQGFQNNDFVYRLLQSQHEILSYLQEKKINQNEVLHPTQAM
ncbi:hypothetical protein [Vibrio lentus]|uniref:hypothetical protein n=1 Tax=Vibrio lentus TaxID=136468 RepID=UPI000C821F27|nr:hypothetical protein [Vibrio lentus]PMJ90358.1 hypothetical protein BCU14_24665 [Vibrio lentus]PMN36425.1 hypothetical protein BCT33_06390 [Vibrio lentus]PMN63214.1 hypothetical protein BCT29_13830 [Vibrio lentus]